MAISSSRDMTSKLFTRVPAAELRTWAPFVRKDALRAGDILLSRGRGLDSFVIALASGGRYSHAAVFLPFRFDESLPFRLDEDEISSSLDEAMRKWGSFRLKGVHLDLVEADDYGVGAVPPRPLSIAFGGRRNDVIRLPGKIPPKAAILLRHPDIKSIDERRLEQEVRTFSDSELLRRYSSMDRLVSPLPLPQPIKRVLGRVLLWRYPQPKRLVLPGCFCSELVVRFFERLGIPLFAGAAVPENISPNHLASSKSLLKAVPDAIITAADIPDDAHGEVLDVLQNDLRHGELDNPETRGQEPKRTYLSSWVEVREGTELLLPAIKKTIEDTAADTAKLGEILRASDDFIREKQGAVVHAQILHALSTRTIAPPLHRTLDVLLVRSTFLGVLREYLRGEQVPEEAGSALRRIHDRAIIELAYRHMRAQTLARMSLARRLPAGSRQEWMQALADWRAHKAQCAQAKASLSRPTLRSPTPDGCSDAEINEWVKKVLGEVTARAKSALSL